MRRRRARGVGSVNAAANQKVVECIGRQRGRTDEKVVIVKETCCVVPVGLSVGAWPSFVDNPGGKEIVVVDHIVELASPTAYTRPPLVPLSRTSSGSSRRLDNANEGESVVVSEASSAIAWRKGVSM